MKNPKKLELYLSLGLIIITVVYLMIAISMSINGGSFSQMRQFIENIMGNKKVDELFLVYNKHCYCNRINRRNQWFFNVNAKIHRIFIIGR